MIRQSDQLSLNNMEKYQDPEFYDLQYQDYQKDFPFMLEWAQKQKGTIVDLACGTGRITIPLAEHGFNMIGIDIHEGMLNRAKEKTSNTNLPIQWVQQNCMELSLDLLSPFIYMTGNSFQHFLTNEAQNMLLRSVHSHLEDDGIFIFNTRFPLMKELMENGETAHTYIDKRDRKVTEYEKDIYNPLTQILISTSIREIHNKNGELTTVEKDSISLRYVFPMEMERMLDQNGFEIVHLYRSWEKAPLENESAEMIYVCKKKN